MKKIHKRNPDKDRIENLKLRKNKVCEVCGNPDRYISGENGYRLECHHIDKNPSNHHSTNLMLLCARCHGMFHRKEANKHIQYLNRSTKHKLIIDYIKNKYYEEL